MDGANEFFRKSYYNSLRLLLSFGGIWPYHTANKRYATYLGLLLMLGTGLTFEVLGVIEVRSESLEVIVSVPLLALAVVSLIKLLYGIQMLPEIKILLMKIREYWYSPKSNEETKILHSYALYGRNLTYLYSGFLIGSLLIYHIVTLSSKYSVDATTNETSSNTYRKQAGLPYRVNYIIDPDTFYIPIYLHTSVCVTYYSILMIMSDVLYLTLVQHCCGLFAAIRYRLESIIEYGNNDNSDSVCVSMRDRLSLNIAYSIRRHVEVIQFVSIMESMHRMPLLVHVAANVSVLSLLGFQILTRTEDIHSLLMPGLFFNALIINTFFENWQGQRIIDSSGKIYESAYNTKWYEMPMSQRKFVIMIMMSNKEPLKVTAGKFIALSYVNFSVVIRTASSYFMLLRTLQ